MAANTLNIDALIRRADLYDTPQTAIDQSALKTDLAIRDLEPGEFLAESLRKPDFQRETTDWEPLKIVELVESFAEGDLIPAVIFWRHGDLNFVVDGAHRLGALIAWVRDDYGDGPVSQQFFGPSLSNEQKVAAERTRKVVERRVGSYRDLKHAASNPSTANVDHLRIARNLSARALKIQWVNGDADKVEASFKRINQKAAPIDKTELLLIETRHKAPSIASRAIQHGGRGNEYWKRFEDAEKLGVQAKGKEAFELLFHPDAVEFLKSADAPLGGSPRSSQTLLMVLDLVLNANGLAGPDVPLKDETGAETNKVLKKSVVLLRRLTGMHASSLGLHPLVYFYSAIGKHQPVLLLAFCDWILEWETAHFIEFTDIRQRFEQYLVDNKRILGQIIRKFGSKSSGRANIATFYEHIADILQTSDDSGNDITLAVMKANSTFSFLQPNEAAEGEVKNSDFSSETKAAIFMREGLAAAKRCALCGSVLSSSAITIDHKQDKKDGGLGAVDNGQLAHPFCNTTYKDWKAGTGGTTPVSLT